MPRPTPETRTTTGLRLATPLAAILLMVAASGCVIRERSRQDAYLEGRFDDTSRDVALRFEEGGHDNSAIDVANADETQPDLPPPGRWFLPAGEVCGAAVLASGLNNHPSSIEAYADLLTSRGVAAFVTTLTHQGDRMHGATLEIWVDEIDAAWNHIADRFPDVPLFQLAYSTGGMATVVHALDHPDPRRQGLVLIAPAIKLRAYAYLSRPPRWLRGRDLVFPSRAPERYRAHRYTSWDSYGALFDGLSRLSAVDHSPELSRVPAVVVMSPGDELLSYRRIEKWANERQLPWDFVPVRTERGFEHLVLDDSCGIETWGKIRSAVLSHIDDALRP